MHGKGALVFLGLISLLICVNGKLCCGDRECDTFCGKAKYGICTGNPNCQTTSNGLTEDKITGQGKCKCTEKERCCDDRVCSCPKGYTATCNATKCFSQITATGDADIHGQGLCDCIRSGCCTDLDCKKTCSGRSVVRCVEPSGTLCSSGKCICDTKCAKRIINIYNDCKKAFGSSCSPKEGPLRICENGKCRCTDQAECRDSNDCQARLSASGHSTTQNIEYQSYEKLVCKKKSLEAICEKGRCKCREKLKCTVSLCHVALENELDCCLERFAGKVDLQKKCADDRNKRYSKCVKNPNCIRDENYVLHFPNTFIQCDRNHTS